MCTGLSKRGSDDVVSFTKIVEFSDKWSLSEGRLGGRSYKQRWRFCVKFTCVKYIWLGKVQEEKWW